MQQNARKYFSQVLQQNEKENPNFSQLSPMSEGSNQPDLNVPQWLHDSSTLIDYQREMGTEGSWE